MTPEQLSRNVVSGRPPKEIDVAQLEALSASFCSQNEIAAFFGVHQTTLAQRLRDSPDHRMAYERGVARAIVNLRRRQVDMALGREPEVDKDGKVLQPGRPPNTRMLVWLGKQYLGQSDRLTAIVDPLQRGAEVMAHDEVVVRWDQEMEATFQVLEGDILDAEFKEVLDDGREAAG